MSHTEEPGQDQSVTTPATANGGNGFILIVAATGLVGVAGYLITVWVPALIGVGPYSIFAVFWAFIFLVATALSGIQQEITRGTEARLTGDSTRSGQAGKFALVTSFAVLLAVLGSAPFWQSAVFPEHGWAMVLPLAVGVASYVPLAVLAGSLYGIGHWKALFALVSIEGLLRLVLVIAAAYLKPEAAVFAWAIAIPFPVAVLAVWPFARVRIVGKTRLDVALPRLTWNVGRTIVAAAAMGIMISGFPLVLKLTSPTVSADDLGIIVLAATLTRAPLIVVGMALQSFLIVFFRARAAQFWRTLLMLEGVVVAIGLTLAVLGYLLGPPIFAFVYPKAPTVDGWIIATLVLSSALVGALCVSAPAVLSRNAHSAFSAGWIVAALATIGCLLLPLPFIDKTVLALLVGPAAGILVHAVYLVAVRKVPIAAA
ncbi:lipopolysaccharide biosynthesis protein [Cryobacterium sp. W22_MBD10_FK3]|uniref:lipopolysaccharide biosynthesis protein n=1 Tax=Cryobacterium sp. W22_MBD10_FK3 TaxID=3240273 RepID=UPI003F8F679A